MSVDVSQFERGPFGVFLCFWPPPGVDYEGLEDARGRGEEMLAAVGLKAHGRVDHVTEQLIFEYSTPPGPGSESLAAVAQVVSALEGEGFRYSGSEHERIHAAVAARLPHA